MRTSAFASGEACRSKHIFSLNVLGSQQARRNLLLGQRPLITPSAYRLPPEKPKYSKEASTKWHGLVPTATARTNSPDCQSEGLTPPTPPAAPSPPSDCACQNPSGEPAIDRSEQFGELPRLALVAPEACEAHGGAQACPRIWLVVDGRHGGCARSTLPLSWGTDDFSAISLANRAPPRPRTIFPWYFAWLSLPCQRSASSPAPTASKNTTVAFPASAKPWRKTQQIWRCVGPLPA